MKNEEWACAIVSHHRDSLFFIFHSLFFILYFPVSSPKSVALVLPVMRTCTVSPM
jgi:hypothetical protein